MSDVSRGAAANYDTLDLDAICALPVEEISEDDAILGLWVPSSMMLDGLRVMDEWGFRQKQTWVWVKTAPSKGAKRVRAVTFRECAAALSDDGLLPVYSDGDGLAFGMGHLGRNAHEVMLLGVRGRPSRIIGSRSERTVHLAPAMPHSQKPECVQDALDRLVPEGPRLELFARRDRPGWLCIGNESPVTPGMDVRAWFRMVT